MKRVLAPITLFFIAPFIAEYLLGNMPIKMLGALVVLAPMYGGGALLIRETVQRTRRGWPSVFVLALAYGVLEEGLVMQSLFNPNFLGLNQHLLQPAYLATLGIGLWWTVFVLTLHTVWSIPVSIVISEALVLERAHEPWLNRTGTIVVTVMSLLGCASITSFTFRNAPVRFFASPRQLADAAMCVVILTATALVLPLGNRVRSEESAPPYLIVALAALAAGSTFLAIPARWGWLAVWLYILLDAVAIGVILTWSRMQAWGAGHRFALSAGAAGAYALRSFVTAPAIGNPNRVGNAVFALGLLVVCWIGARQIRPVNEGTLSQMEVK